MVVSNSKKLKIAVLFGGSSREHEVSIKSGENVAAHLDKNKYEVKRILIDGKGNWQIPPSQLKKHADLAFIALHGGYGEDGSVQDILEIHKIPYTGSGVGASALGMNKFLSLRHFRDGGLETPQTHLFDKSDWQENKNTILDSIRHYVGFPAVLKPNREGSSFGVSIALNLDDAADALGEIFSAGKEAIAQPYIQGREMTCAVIDHGSYGSEFALLPTEIIPKKNKFFDYDSKYESGGAEEITPPLNLTENLIKELRKTAITAHRLIGARSFSRTDMILDKNGNIFVLEINTIPGLTEQSLLPKAAEASGIPFSKILDKIIESSFGR
ncbi:MAG: D-alanine--D-alanine ligase [Candidatus Liptonbacteria bacterium]|nr:D-alanine--D-alanine ligase [Candidatus Liptonbacteria bacterium]